MWGFVVVPPEAVEGTVIVSDDGEEAELVGLRHGEAIEEDAFGEGEDDGVGSDAEGERGHGDCGEAGAAAKHANGVAEVLPEVFGSGLPCGGTDFFFYGFDAAHLDAGAALGFVGAEAPAAFF